MAIYPKHDFAFASNDAIRLQILDALPDGTSPAVDLSAYVGVNFLFSINGGSKQTRAAVIETQAGDTLGYCNYTWQDADLVWSDTTEDGLMTLDVQLVGSGGANDDHFLPDTLTFKVRRPLPT